MDNVKVTSIELTGVDFGFEGKTVSVNVGDKVRLHLSNKKVEGAVTWLSRDEIRIGNENNIILQNIGGIEIL